MKTTILAAIVVLSPIFLYAQNELHDNVYKIREAVLHTETDKEIKGGNEDDDVAKFNRWFNMAEVRSYPSGNLSHADALLNAYNSELPVYKKQREAKLTGNPAPWQVLGPIGGVGRVNCIVVNPQNSNTIYIGSACGGVWISHDGGSSWASNSDNFPSMSIADIAVNPLNPDTIYAATGDGYGYEEDATSNIFWGGLYTAGVLRSIDGGNTWAATSFSYQQLNRNIIQKLIINPAHPNILMAGTRQGIFRTTDAGTSWQSVYPSQVYSMAFRPGNPDTVYASTHTDLLVSYNVGANWQTLYAGISSGTSQQGPSQDRVSIAVSAASPNSIWVLDNNDKLKCSHDGGLSFDTSFGSPPANFYGYYDRVLAVSPVDSNNILACGMNMEQSHDGGYTWQTLGSATVHVDNHAIAFDPQNPSTFYNGNDGGVYVTADNGQTWNDIGDSIVISQIYRTISSRQDPYVLLCGLQDNSTLRYDGYNWNFEIGGDGQACAIHQQNDYIQIGSYQGGRFFLSTDQGNTFNPLNIGAFGAWTSPVVFNPNSTDTIYFGLGGIYASYDMGNTFTNLTPTDHFTHGYFPGATCLAMAPSNTHILYAADNGHIIRTTNGGGTWTDITGNLPANSVAITHIAVDFNNPMRVFVTMSGYNTGQKVYVNNTGGITWANISYNLPNIPANCIAVDSSTNGALFVGTDMGMYYTDATMSSWTKYSTGLPNVIVNDIDINYTNYKIRAGTYGRGLWECDLPKVSLSVPNIPTVYSTEISLYPNPANDAWNIVFLKNKVSDYSVSVSNMTGQIIYRSQNQATINASSFASGIYIVDVCINKAHYYIKAVKN